MDLTNHWDSKDLRFMLLNGTMAGNRNARFDCACPGSVGAMDNRMRAIYNTWWVYIQYSNNKIETIAINNAITTM
jgi:hypothetical protein